MLFHSFSFLIFFSIVFVIYWAIPHRFRWILLLITSYYFYMSWNTKYVFLILFTTVITYISALLLENTTNIRRRKWILGTSIFFCLGTLFLFKYFDFFNHIFLDLLHVFSFELHTVTLNLLLPVGISFYTFQTMSYVIDVYRHNIHAEQHFGKYAAFISFFPQLVAGPIERAKNLLPQLNKQCEFDYDSATYGLKLMAWGYFKKMVIADNVSPYVQLVYDNPESFQGFSLVIATLLFSLQIYCDFSGYSDIAIGASKMLGINLMTNFRSPYFSKSLKEFWSRWHISLSTWFKDYVYIPLGGSHCHYLRKCFNLFITFLFSGLWHGANWTYVMWGGIHGTARVIEDVFTHKGNKIKNKHFNILKMFIIYIFCCFAWIFFVSESLSDAWYVITHLFTGIGTFDNYLLNGLMSMELLSFYNLILGLCILLLFIYDAINLHNDCIKIVSHQPTVVRYTFYLFLLFLILYFKSSTQAEFVYFQF